MEMAFTLLHFYISKHIPTFEKREQHMCHFCLINYLNIHLAASTDSVRY